MSVLSDTRILSAIYSQEFQISPLQVDHVQPSSVDLTLSENIRVPKEGLGIVPPYPNSEELEDFFEDGKLEDGGFVLKAGAFVLAQVNEKIRLSDKMVGKIHNRNSIIRLGINAGLSSYINPGYEGQLPITIHNAGTFEFKLTPGMRICQLVLHETHGVFRDYSKRDESKYQDETKITLSKLSEDKEFADCIKKHGKTVKCNDIVTFIKVRIEEKSQNFLDQLSKEQKEMLGLT